jgi:hypothetical protein
MEPPEFGRRGLWLPLGVVATVLLAFFLPVVAGGESFFGRDVTPFFYPMKQLLAEAMRSGRLPLWNPLVAGGEPFFATLQPGALYPGSLILYLLPFPQGVDWLIVIHFLFAGAGWILLLRHEGLSPAASTLGALAFVLGGFFVSLGNFVNNLQTMSWAPWLFLAWAQYLGDGRTIRLLAFTGACVAAFLGGEPQLLALLLALVFARGLLGPSPAEVRRTRQAAAFTGAGVLALLVSGFQLVPFIEFVGQSVRTLPLEMAFTASRSQEPIGLLHMLIPPALGHGDYGFTTRFFASADVPWLLSLYPGMVVAGFAGLGLLAIRRRERVFWLVLSVLGLGLALGAHTPVYPGLFAALPPFRALRYPEKFALLFAVAVPFLAGAGFDRWRARPVLGARLGWSLLGLAVAYGLLGALLRFWPGALAAACAVNEASRLCGDPATAAELYAAVAWRLAALLVAASGVIVLVRRETLHPGMAAWLLVGLAALDLVSAHRPVNPSVDSSIYTATPWAAAVLAPVFDRRDEYRFRGTPVSAAMGEVAQVGGAHELSNMYLDVQALGPNTAQSYGFPQQDGLQGVELNSVAMTHEAALRDWADEPVRFLQMMNVRYYADPTAGAESMQGLRDVARHPELPIRLYEVPDPLPRAYVAEGWETSAGPADALRRALQPDWTARRVVLEDVPMSAPAAGRAEGRIVATTWEPERVRLIARTSEPAVLVLLDRWYPGWKATVNGEPTRLLRANGVFRAVEIPAGQADVEFVYAPASLVIGGWMSVLGITTCIFVWGWLRRREVTA